ncbi:MAG: putative metallo-hydrolase [Deltaproteobacteria bacterium ADurb.BinA179]|jgi:glyoxylase-like metal-dependent hydrolase (beta-lactamase superfamily II)|nr:MBL fold metallo-hydrolase [Deltaproteobacteria bacterium]MDI9543690.1 MBL fold metallo-hydrolase [Pseudomonadota bacterium]OPZ29415.1 MAG: putative metallo-hydrolase [Deltaproteobacteria bacterium ADurb.BinA179]HRR20168.1 MBL fold metallo-hydrolase [Desulfomonilia bacterium]HNU75782.1 MBL fold metallo-hydrolase [Deltaproteobacteria bacterium]
MVVHTVVVTEFMTNCFIVGDEITKEAVVIDPGGEGQKILKEIEKMGMNVKAVVSTHAHVDHIGALKDIKNALGADIMMHQAELPVLKTASRMARLFGISIDDPPEPDRFIAEGDQVSCGSITLKVIETPGHSPGGISLLTSDGKVCFAGDTLFAGSIGRTDLPGGDYHTLIESIKTKLIPLGDDVKVLSGHGPATTMGVERRYNPFL